MKAFASALALLTAASAMGQTFVRMEAHPIETVTLDTQQVLTGDMNGKRTVIAGQLRIPKPGDDRLPAVIIVHSSGGINASTNRWADELNSIGLAVFVIDSFSGRGILNTINDQSQLDSLSMMVDAYRALSLLAKHSRIDSSRIAVMGFSKGAVAAVYSSNRRFVKLYAPADVTFAAHIGLFTPCNVRYRDDEDVTVKPIRLFHGTADDYVPIAPCRAYVERLKKAGADASLTEYPGAHHSYDNFTRAAPLKLPQGQTTRNCVIQESDNGRVVNTKTNQLFSYKDPCVEVGPQIAYDPKAYEATLAEVKGLLSKTLAK